MTPFFFSCAMHSVHALVISDSDFTIFSCIVKILINALKPKNSSSFNHLSLFPHHFVCGDSDLSLTPHGSPLTPHESYLTYPGSLLLEGTTGSDYRLRFPTKWVVK